MRTMLTEEEVHEKVMQRLIDIWNDEYLTPDEFNQAYQDIKEQILEEY